MITNSSNCYCIKFMGLSMHLLWSIHHAHSNVYVYSLSRYIKTDSLAKCMERTQIVVGPFVSHYSTLFVPTSILFIFDFINLLKLHVYFMVVWSWVVYQKCHAKVKFYLEIWHANLVVYGLLYIVSYFERILI